MLTISKPLSASQARTYHEREFASERQNYWSPINEAKASGRAGSHRSGSSAVQSSLSTSRDLPKVCIRTPKNSLSGIKF